jgi:streptogramin lyase
MRQLITLPGKRIIRFSGLLVAATILAGITGIEPVFAASPPIAEYPTPTTGSGPDGITTGPDGNLWFTDDSTIRGIGKITTAGVITQYPLPAGAALAGFADTSYSHSGQAGTARSFAY